MPNSKSWLGATDSKSSNILGITKKTALRLSAFLRLFFLILLLPPSVSRETLNGEHSFYRVNFEVSNPNPFPYLAFRRSKAQRTPSEIPSFYRELMAIPDCFESPVGARLLV